MGDGVAAMVALLVELCLASDKVFVVEEPENDLHPTALRALLELVRLAADRGNQFLVSTHSNIVVRELGSAPNSKLFEVARTGTAPYDPSTVELVPEDTASRFRVLHELGYGFADLHLHDAWLILEESSAEQIIEHVLVPFFAPRLKGRLRTYSAAGVTNVEPAVTDFLRLTTFVHLEPVYRDRVWVRTDNDVKGRTAIERLRDKFPYLDEQRCRTFQKSNFEEYFPDRFADAVRQALAEGNKEQRRAAKAALLREALQWTSNNPMDAKPLWENSASEVIELLLAVGEALRGQ
jgi:hypothetical protein